MRKRKRNNWLALQVQLFRQGGGKVAEVAEQFGCSTRNTFKLSRRKFPRIVLVVLCRVLNVNVPKGSGGSVHQKHPGTGTKETLRTVSLDEGPRDVATAKGTKLTGSDCRFATYFGHIGPLNGSELQKFTSPAQSTKKGTQLYI